MPLLSRPCRRERVQGAGCKVQGAGEYWYSRDAFIKTLTPPGRTPTGKLFLLNSSKVTATNIRATRAGTVYSIPSSISPGQTQEYNLPTGTYRIDLQMGPDRQHLTDYLLEGVTIPRGEKTKSINMPFDFSEVKK
jgi:hypothetical protein